MTSPISSSHKPSVPCDEDLAPQKKPSLLKSRFLTVETKRQKQSLKQITLPINLPVIRQTKYDLSFKISYTPEPFTGVRTEKLENGDTYQGLFKDGLFHGFGIIRDQDGKAKFRGQFHLGKKVCGQENPPDLSSPGYFYNGPKIFGKDVYCAQVAVFVRYDENEKLTAAYIFQTREKNRFELTLGKILDDEWACGDFVIMLRVNELKRQVFFENVAQEGFGINETETECYVGMFKNGKYHGFGHLNLIREARTIVGVFEDGELISGKTQDS